MCIYIYLESHNPIFFWSNGLDHFVWSLRLWSSGATCVRVCYGFLRFFFNKMLKKYGFATSRLVWEQLRLFTAFFQQNVEKIRFCYGQDCNVILIWPFFLVITGKNNILPKKLIITAFSQNDQKILCFWLSRYIYIYYTYVDSHWSLYLSIFLYIYLSIDLSIYTSNSLMICYYIIYLGLSMTVPMVIWSRFMQTGWFGPGLRRSDERSRSSLQETGQPTGCRTKIAELTKRGEVWEGISNESNASSKSYPIRINFGKCSMSRVYVLLPDGSLLQNLVPSICL